MFVSEIVARVRAEDVARQGFSRAGYCKLSGNELFVLENMSDRARHGWEFRAKMQEAFSHPFVWVDRVGGEIFWENSIGDHFVAINR